MGHPPPQTTKSNCEFFGQWGKLRCVPLMADPSTPSKGCAKGRSSAVLLRITWSQMQMSSESKKKKKTFADTSRKRRAAWIVELGSYLAELAMFMLRWKLFWFGVRVVGGGGCCIFRRSSSTMTHLRRWSQSQAHAAEAFSVCLFM